MGFNSVFKGLSAAAYSLQYLLRQRRHLQWTHSGRANCLNLYYLRTVNTDHPWNTFG